MKEPGWIIIANQSPFSGDHFIGPFRGWFAKWRARRYAKSYVGRHPFGMCMIYPETDTVMKGDRVIWDGKPLKDAVEQVKKFYEEYKEI